MAMAFNAVIPQTSASWAFTSSQKKSLQASFSTLFSRPRNHTFHGSFSPLAASSKTESTLAELQHRGDGFTPASTSSDSDWLEFARNVSGEWDGFGADFSAQGVPVELPESVVPEAFREWEVKVFDWQTQCPTLADERERLLAYKVIKLLPTVGCEADAATRHSVDEREIGGVNIRASAFAYQSSGCYVSVWRGVDKGGYELLELEHCLVNPRDRESRMRVIQEVRAENGKFALQGVTVFVEQWYGPFRNGDQLGGCSIRDSAFASTPVLKASEVVGVWRGSKAVATFDGSVVDVFQPLVDGRDQKSIREEGSVILLPKQLWCSIKESNEGETTCEVGWLLNPGHAITSHCIFSSQSALQEVSIASETLEGMQFISTAQYQNR